MKDGMRHRVDMRMNKKLNKAYDISNVVRTEVEFVVAADFMKMRQEFTKVLLSNSANDQ